MAQINSNTGPHIRCEENTRSIMLDVLIALCPSLIWGFYAFGLRAAVLFVLSVSSGIFFEWLILKIFKGRKGNAADLSAAVTGAILVCLMPVGVPLWMAPTASFLAIVLFKHLCGGSPNNRLNPALAALSLLYVIFPEHLTRLSRPFEYLPAIKALPDGAQKDVFDVSRTFQLFKSGAFPEDLTWSQLLTGSVAGGVASTSTLLLLAGGLYLLVRRVISWHIPIIALFTSALCCLLFVPEGIENRFAYAGSYLLSGALIFCVVFAATDPVTSPITRRGKSVFAVLLGVLTFFIRSRFGVEGVGFAILLAELSARFWDFLFRPRVYGMPSQPFRSLAMLPQILKQTFLRNKDAFLQTKNLVLKIVKKK